MCACRCTTNHLVTAYAPWIIHFSTLHLLRSTACVYVVHPSIHPSIRPSIHPSIHLSVHLSIHLSIFMSLQVICIYEHIHEYTWVYSISIYRLVQASGTASTWIRLGGGVGWDVNVHVNLRQQLMLRTRGVGGVGWGGMLTFMWTCGSSWCYAHAGWGGWGEMLTFMWTCGSSWCYAHAGWGGVGWDVNVHVNLRQQLMLRWYWWCWWWWWWTWPKWNLLIPRRNFVTEWTSFTNLIQVYAVPEAWTRLYIHIYIYRLH